MAKKKKPDEFFGEDTKFWMGRVVGVSAQKKQIDGYGWGWRYKVRIFGSYTDQDVSDSEVHTATAMLGVSDGSGGGGRSRSLRITQGDMVFGFYMAPDEGFPVIIGVFPRTRESETKTGFTGAVKKGLAPVEINEQGGAPIPVLNDNKNTKGPTNPSKTTPGDLLQKQLGIDPKQMPQLGAIPNPLKPLADRGKELIESGGLKDIASKISKSGSLGSGFPISADTIKTIGQDIPEVITEFVNDPATGDAVAASIGNVKSEVEYAAGKLNLSELRARTAARNETVGQRVGDVFVDLDDDGSDPRDALNIF